MPLYKATAQPVIRLTPQNFSVSGGAPTITLYDANQRWFYWAMRDAQSDGISTQVGMPSSWNTFDVDLLLVNPGSGSGNVRIDYRIKGVDVGEALTAGSQALYTHTAGSQGVLQRLTIATGQAAADLVGIRVLRLGADAADTLTNDFGVLGVELKFAT